VSKTDKPFLKTINPERYSPQPFREKALNPDLSGLPPSAFANVSCNLYRPGNLYSLSKIEMTAFNALHGNTMGAKPSYLLCTAALR